MHDIVKKNGTLIITFDDARPGVYEYARPLFINYGISGTVFAIGKWCENGKSMPGWQLFNLYHDHAWDVFSHTWDHSIMTNNTPEHNDLMLKKNLEWLRSIGIDQPELFCYPWGKHSQEVDDVVKKYHRFGRGVYRENRNEGWPIQNHYGIASYPLSNYERLDNLMPRIDYSRKNKSMVMVYIHDVKKVGDKISCTPEQLEELILYCSDMNILNFSSWLQLSESF